LDPNLAIAHAAIGVAKYFVGRGSETESHIREMFRLNPRDTFTYACMAHVGVVKLTLGSDEEAVTWLQRAVAANPNYPAAHFWLASTLAHLDRLDDARSAVQRGLALDPTFTVSRFRAHALSSNPVYLAQRERIIGGMRKTGAPEE
jgi:tetratricopeptide (TPR) repeat protein